MIRVTYWRKSNKVKIIGHAGSAPYGEDLVCAAVSALVYTLAANAAMLRDDGYTRRIITKIEPGNSEIDIIPKRRYKNSTALVVSTVCVGFGLLAKQYPEYIQFREII